PLELGEWPVADITPDTIEQFREVRLRAGKGAVGTNRYLGYLRALWNWALKHDQVQATPFRRHDVVVVKLDKTVEQARTRRLQPAEEGAWLGAAPAHVHALIIGALETGMRRGELLSLQWRQVEGLRVIEREGTFTVEWAPRAEIYLPAAKTKTKRDRRIPI